MKLTFSTVACMDWDYERIFETLKEFNMDGLEFRLPENINALIQSGKLDELRGLSDTYGIKIIDLGSSLLLNRYNSEQLSDFEKLAEAAYKLNAGAIRIFLGNFLTRKTDTGVPIDYQGLIKLLQAFSTIAADHHIQVWIETHNEFSTGKTLHKLLDDVNRENIKIIWDIIHTYEENESYQETYAALGDRIAHIHIKDGIKPKDETLVNYLYTKLGEGSLPIPEIVRYCESMGYPGYYSLEWESLWKQEIKHYNTKEIFCHFTNFMAEIN